MPAALLLLAASAASAGAPQAWLDWRAERRAELARPLSPAALAVMTVLQEGAEKALERKGEAWRVRLATEPARGEEAARFALAGGTVAVRGAFGAERLVDRRELRLPSLGLGLKGYDRGGGRFTLLVFDLRRSGVKALKRVDAFPYDPAFAVKARLVKLAAPEKVSFQHSDGQVRALERLGRLEFALKGRPQSLSAHGSASGRDLFLLFKDPTNGKTSYGAGRYLYLRLDAPWSESEEAALDLNFAFSPYCRYSGAYSCPLATDRLDVPVTAGERMPPGSSSH